MSAQGGYDPSQNIDYNSYDQQQPYDHNYQFGANNSANDLYAQQYEPQPYPADGPGAANAFGQAYEPDYTNYTNQYQDVYNQQAQNTTYQQHQSYDHHYNMSMDQSPENNPYAPYSDPYSALGECPLPTPTQIYIHFYAYFCFVVF